MNDFIKSPLNYTGNKYRILSQITEFFPKEINCMIDLFCGGATVGLNVNAKKVIFVDSNKQVINLLIYLSNLSFDCFISLCENLIEKYHLSYSYKYGYKKYKCQCHGKNDNNGLKDYNSEGFYQLRNDYNMLKDKNSSEANIMLYMLMVYGFNNDIRFNADGDFNLPVGKTDLNKNNVDKIKNYIDRVKTIEAQFLCMSFDSAEFKKILKEADFVYMDPPYLITQAVYNSVWDNKWEHKLLDFIDELIRNNINFALSNVLQKVGKVNEPLSYWTHKRSEQITIHHIEYNYRSSSYNKIKRDAEEQEVLIVNRTY